MASRLAAQAQGKTYFVDDSDEIFLHGAGDACVLGTLGRELDSSGLDGLYGIGLEWTELEACANQITDWSRAAFGQTQSVHGGRRGLGAVDNITTRTFLVQCGFYRTVQGTEYSCMACLI